MKLKSTIPKHLQLLAEEAMRFNSGEDFVNSRNFYQHGTSRENAADIEKGGFSLPGANGTNGGNAFGEGIYLDKTGEGAKLYGDKVLDVAFTSHPKLFKASGECVSCIHDLFVKETNYGEPELITKHLQSKGYDGVDCGNQVVVFDPKDLLTKSQLFAFYALVTHTYSVKKKKNHKIRGKEIDASFGKVAEFLRNELNAGKWSPRHDKIYDQMNELAGTKIDFNKL